MQYSSRIRLRAQAASLPRLHRTSNDKLMGAVNQVDALASAFLDS